MVLGSLSLCLSDLILPLINIRTTKVRGQDVFGPVMALGSQYKTDVILFYQGVMYFYLKLNRESVLGSRP